MCSVGEFGIDSNIFASNYKAPTNHDHIGMAMVHADNSDKKSKGAVKGDSKGGSKVALPEKKSKEKSDTKAQLQAPHRAQLTLLDELNVFDKDYKKPLLGHWVHDEDKPGQYKWLTGQEFAEGNYKELEHKPRVVNPGPSTLEFFCNSPAHESKTYELQ